MEESPSDVFSVVYTSKTKPSFISSIHKKQPPFRTSSSSTVGMWTGMHQGEKKCSIDRQHRCVLGRIDRCLKNLRWLAANGLAFIIDNLINVGGWFYFLLVLWVLRLESCKGWLGPDASGMLGVFVMVVVQDDRDLNVHFCSVCKRLRCVDMLALDSNGTSDQTALFHFATFRVIMWLVHEQSRSE